MCALRIACNVKCEFAVFCNDSGNLFCTPRLISLVIVIKVYGDGAEEQVITDGHLDRHVFHCIGNTVFEIFNNDIRLSSINTKTNFRILRVERVFSDISSRIFRMECQSVNAIISEVFRKYSIGVMIPCAVAARNINSVILTFSKNDGFIVLKEGDLDVFELVCIGLGDNHINGLLNISAIQILCGFAHCIR